MPKEDLFALEDNKLRLEEMLEGEFVKQPEGRLFLRRCYMCQSVEIGGKIFLPTEYEEALDSSAILHSFILPGRPLPAYPVQVSLTDTLLSRECLAKQMVGQQRYYQKDGITMLGRYSPEDVQKMRAYQAIEREKCR